MNTHTIHWHGIEPTPMNDGVGKHSFEVDRNFVCQYQTNEAGTYFYHCHKNTTLHFEMGLFGLFLVDPPSPDPNIPAPYFRPPGFVAGRLTTDPLSVETIRYDLEKLWVADEFDSRWHFPESNHNHNMQDCDMNDPANPPLRITTARRFDLIIDTNATGAVNSNTRIDFYEWMRGVPNELVATLQIPVIIR